MIIDEALKRAEELIAPYAKESNRPEPNRLDIYIENFNVVKATEALYNDHWGYLSAITGLDLGLEANALEVLYHFCSRAAILTLRVRQPRLGGWVPSIYHLVAAAGFFERELIEMLGVQVKGTPDASRLFIPDDWPAGVYPLLKDFSPEQIQKPTAQPVEPPAGQVGNKFIVPIGPQHPALKEPGHFEFTVDGEIIKEARMRLGYAHRGIEKATESQTWIQNLYLLERVCGICSHTHAAAYASGVERLAAVEVPARARAIRELVAGLERIHSHLLWLGVAAHEAGFDTLFMYSWRDRETVMNLLEELSGNRVHYSANVLGGVKFDITESYAISIRQGMDYLEERARHYLEVVTTDAMFLQRTRGVGAMTKAEAEYYGVLGPTARASGVMRDIRVEAPYGPYRSFPVSLSVETAGDLEARFVVRIKEILVSCQTIRAIIDNLPEGELAVRMPRRIPAGETISRVEAPRGELFYFIRSNGSDKPDRIKIRTPSLCNWTSVLRQAIGSQLADVPLLIAGMDPCFSCNDRMIIVKNQHGAAQTLSWADLRQYRLERKPS